MKTVSILEDDDLVESTDWCRPLCLTTMHGGYSDDYSFESMYSGQPENNVLWVQVHQIFGEMWIGKPVQELNDIGIPYEFIRGNVPTSHQYGLTNRDIRAKNEECLQQQITVGKHKGKTWSQVRNRYPDYYRWAELNNMVPRYRAE